MRQKSYKYVLEKSQEIAWRFWYYAGNRAKGECWNWKSGLSSNDYGQYRWGKRKVKAHRVAWQLLFGPIPDGKIICHHCDNKKCVNPNHLFLGTHKDNAQDREKKGRGGDGGSKTKKQTGIARGTNNPAAKLKESNIKRIRELYQQGCFTYFLLGKHYQVSQSQIANIVHRRSWKHVE